ncbi:MAG: ABC transporter ATP-binding protein [Treponema sp.]|jgi:NitT/TauT family transport system ATP-binding protein|nr:ABC transporter ATP-binding protein [Treponema sp.]
MKLVVQDLCFGFNEPRGNKKGTNEKLIFDRFSLEVGDEHPLLILGPSGCGKTTLLRLMATLLKPWSGVIRFEPDGTRRAASFVFQEPRLLPWLTVLDNVILPIKKALGREAAEKRGKHILELVSLDHKVTSYPGELSGGQQQRASIARAFAYPAPVLFMDEPFQSLDIPLRIELMELTLHLLKAEQRLCIVVTHDPREAIYLGRRIIVLGNAPQGIIFDEVVDMVPEERAYAAPGHSRLEGRLLKALEGKNDLLMRS